MKRFTSILLLGCFSLSVSFGALNKSQVNNKPMKYKIEPDQSEYTYPHTNADFSDPIVPSTRNGANFVYVEKSTNGFGMVSQNTRPLFVDLDNENWYATFRQYAGELTTHGQIGSASSSDGEDWDVYTNLNYNGSPPWGGGGVGGGAPGELEGMGACGGVEK